MKNLIHKVAIPIYDEMLYVAFTKEAAFSQFGFSEEEQNKHATCDGLAFEGVDHKGRRVFAIYVEKQGEAINIATLAHECYHIADMLLEAKGMEYKAGSGNEHIAYLVGYLVERVFDCLDLDNQYYNTASN